MSSFGEKVQISYHFNGPTSVLVLDASSFVSFNLAIPKSLTSALPLFNNMLRAAVDNQNSIPLNKDSPRSL